MLKFIYVWETQNFNTLRTFILFVALISIYFTSFSGKLMAQDIEWQQVIGGIHSEYLYDLKATPDYGFLLIGSSFSGKTGNKAASSQGDLDYFLWKMNESGHLEWQKSLGGSSNDFLYSASITQEGGFILGGSSNSPLSGDKKTEGFGAMDYWVVKLNPEGEEEWQITLGGTGNDLLKTIQQTPDGGYIIGGSSDSPFIYDENKVLKGNKTAEHRGSYDFWLVKLNSIGEIEWQKSYGGNFSDELQDILLIEDGYLIGGNSNSIKDTGNKTSPNYGQSDYWVIKLDFSGNEVWQKTYGGKGEDNLSNLLKTEKGYLLSGSSTSDIFIDGGKSSNSKGRGDFWVLEIDEDGEVLWDINYDIGLRDVLVTAVKDKEGGYLLGGYSDTEGKGFKDYIAIKINSKGEKIWEKILGGRGNDYLKGMVEMRDGGYLLAGYSDSPKSDDKDRSSIGGSDYWLIKLGNENKIAEERKLVEIYPNPTYQFVNIIVSEDFKEGAVDVFDMNGRKLQTKKVSYRSEVVDLQSYPPGVYILKVKIDDKTEDVKIIKKGSK